ncbi:hypothetical protein K0B96_07395 [Horticoccus luteus]|uniref:Recombinase A n=1 Tax=Horticoccus luteus TaxID=2862869 RepID=A0A8F9XL79_9BACT|nr:hypothetical protein [Horticoccus luteus]QYM80423.1 hypothetical protein K0B96_07395 [Horticoccus luteus]
MARPAQLAALRHLLAERFPSVPRTVGRVLPTGVEAIDTTAGGLPLGALTEVACTAPSCGGHLLLAQLLAVTRANRLRVALIDSTDSFDPCSFDDDALAHLLWVRCASTAQALQCADLLARDANFGLVVLDLRRAPAADLRRIPGPQWYRLQRAVEPTDLALVVETPRASVPSAQLRLALSAPHAFAALQHERPALQTHLAPSLQRQRSLSTGALSA